MPIPHRLPNATRVRRRCEEAHGENACFFIRHDDTIVRYITRSFSCRSRHCRYIHTIICAARRGSTLSTRYLLQRCAALQPRSMARRCCCRQVAPPALRHSEVLEADPSVCELMEEDAEHARGAIASPTAGDMRGDRDRLARCHAHACCARQRDARRRGRSAQQR